MSGVALLETSYMWSTRGIRVQKEQTHELLAPLAERLCRPARIEFPNLRILLSETHAESWIAWYEDFVIKANCVESQEKKVRSHSSPPT
jgi:hypothetical protein